MNDLMAIFSVFFSVQAHSAKDLDTFDQHIILPNSPIAPMKEAVKGGGTGSTKGEGKGWQIMEYLEYQDF